MGKAQTGVAGVLSSVGTGLGKAKAGVTGALSSVGTGLGKAKTGVTGVLGSIGSAGADLFRGPVSKVPDPEAGRDSHPLQQQAVASGSGTQSQNPTTCNQKRMFRRTPVACSLRPGAKAPATKGKPATTKSVN